MRSRRVMVSGLAVAVAAMGPGTVAVSGAAPGAGSVEPTVLELTPQPVIDGMGWVPTGLGDLGGDAWVEDISATGWLAGTGRVPGGGVSALRWAPGAHEPEVLAGAGGWDIASDGTAVIGTSGSQVPAIWLPDGTLTSLLLPPGTWGYTVSYAINDSHEVVGSTSSDSSSFVGLYWSSPSAEAVVLPGAAENGTGIEINSSGTIVGTADDGGHLGAARWTDPSEPPQLLLPGSYSVAEGLSPSGTVVGVVQCCGLSGQLPFVWDAAGPAPIVIDVGSGWYGGAWAASNDGTIVGSSSPGDGSNAGWVWDRTAGDAFELVGWSTGGHAIDVKGDMIVGGMRNVPGGVRRAVRWELRDVSFVDVPVSSPFTDAITQLVLLGTTTGYADGGFHPTASVSRQALAALVYRTVGWPLGNDPPCAAAPFSDVAVGSTFCGHVAWAADEDVVGGFADGSFRPTSPVSRQAVVAVLYRAMGSPNGVDPTCSSMPFTDVAVAHQFCGEIAWAKAAGVTGGFADGSFRPTAPVSRQAAAAQLHAVHDALVAAG